MSWFNHSNYHVLGGLEVRGVAKFTSMTPFANDGTALGSATVSWSDLYLAAQGVINWANGEATITETNANLLTIGGAALTVTTGDLTLASGNLIISSGTITSSGLITASNALTVTTGTTTLGAALNQSGGNVTLLGTDAARSFTLQSSGINGFVFESSTAWVSDYLPDLYNYGGKAYTRGALITVDEFTVQGGFVTTNGLARTMNSPKLRKTGSLGAELLDNVDMEADSTFEGFGTPTTSERSNTQSHAGTYSWKTTTNSDVKGTHIASASQKTVSVNNYYKFSFWYYGDGSGIRLHILIGGVVKKTIALTATTSWAQYTTNFYADATGVVDFKFTKDGTGGATTFYIDDISMKLITGGTGLECVDYSGAYEDFYASTFWGNGNVVLGSSTAPSNSATNTIKLATGTPPNALAADAIKIYSADAITTGSGAATLSLWVEAGAIITGITGGMTAANHTAAVRVNINGAEYTIPLDPVA